MPQPYFRPAAEIQINRGVYGGFRDDNFNVGWTADIGVVGSTDGDVQKLEFTSSTAAFTKSSLSINAGTYSNIAIRAKSDAVQSIDFEFKISGSWTTKTLSSLPTNDFKLYPFTTGTTGTITDIRLKNQTVPNRFVYIDYVVFAKNPSITLLKEDFDPVEVVRSTSSVDEFSFNLRNEGGLYATSAKQLSLGDDIYVYFGYLRDDLVIFNRSKVFGGTIEELTPSLSSGGDVLKVHGYGWGRALLHVLIPKEYGSLSDNSGITKASDAVKDIIDLVNGSGITSGGYQLTKTYVQTFAPAMSYILFKNDPAFNAIKQLSDLITANNDPTGTTTSPVEFWVDPAENVHLAPLGAWGTDPNPSTYPNALNVGRDQITNDFRKDIESMRNQVHYFSATVKPSNTDAWTETGPIGDWTVVATGGTGGIFTTSYDTSANNFKVNSKSVKGNWTGMSSGTNGIDLVYNPSPTLAMDITKLGGKISPPALKMFLKTDAVSSSYPYAIHIHMMTDATNYFQANYWPTNVLITTFAGGITSGDWQVFEMPIGPYGDFPPGFQTGSPSWTSISRIKVRFLFANTYALGNVWVDGFFIVGQTHWVAKDSTRINGYGLRETPLSNNKVRDPTTQQLLAKSELYRLHNPVLRGSIAVPGIADILPGQKVTITAPSANLSTATLRVLEVRHSFGASEGFTTLLDLTDDLTCYQTLEPTKLSNLFLELHSAPYRKREEQDVYMGEPDPTTAATTVDYPS